MNVMELLTGAAAQAIGWALLHLVWQATIVAGLLAAVLALLPRSSANARYIASCGALALVFAMFLTTAVRGYDPAAAPVVMTDAPANATIDIPLTQVPIVIVATAAASWRDRAIDAVTTARQSLPSVVAFWLLGVLFFSGRLLVSWIRARALVTKGATVASMEWQRVAARLSDALGLKRAVRLLESAAVEVPSVLGTLRPVILLPVSTLTGLTPEQLEMVLAHELAHIRRHDFLMNLLQAFVETLMFYHPAVWWMSRRVRIERENCCDDLAVAVCGNPIQYARALTRLEELRAGASPVVVAANGGSLIDRVRRIAAGRAESTSVSSRWAAAIATLAIFGAALAVPSLPALAQRETQKQNAEQPKTASSTVDVVEPAAANPDAEADTDDEDETSEADARVDEVDPLVPDAAAAPAPAPTADPAVEPRPVQMASANEVDREDDAADEDERDAKSSDKLSIDDIIELRAVGVTPEYIEAMRALFPGVSVRQIAELRSLGVTREFVTDIRSAGLSVTSAREAAELRALGVSPQYVQQMRDAGFTIGTSREATELRAVGVTPGYVRQMREAGLTVRTTREASELRAVGVTPDFVSEMRKAGFAITTAREATDLRAVGVTPAYVRGMREAGLEVRTPRDASELRGIGVTPEFVSEMRNAGLTITTAREATHLRGSGVTPDYVQSLRAAGVKLSSTRDAQSLRNLGVTAEFVRKLAAAGYTDLSVRQLTKMAAYGIDSEFIREMEKYRTKEK